jgi:capsular polysaccharide biosynthesis protein
MYDAIAAAVKQPKHIYEKIYVSRMAMQSRRTFGEGVVQKIFEKNGYKIICPETLPLTEQIALVKNARVLAGCAGTALHLALFMAPGGVVVQIKRNARAKCNADIQNLINDTKRLNGIFISGSVEEKPTDHCSSVPQIIGVNSHMRDFFDAYGFRYDEKDLRRDADDFAEYKRELAEYNKKYGGVGLNDIKHFIIHWSSCFVPGRERRGNFRRWLKRKLNYEG